MTSLPLAHKRILVTRATHQAGKLSEGLRLLGADPVEVPVLEIRPPASYDPLDVALRHLYAYDWLILTSANTVRTVVERAASRSWSGLMSHSVMVRPHLAITGRFATSMHIAVSSGGMITFPTISKSQPLRLNLREHSMRQCSTLRRWPDWCNR